MKKMASLVLVGSLLCATAVLAEDAKPDIEAKEFRPGTKVTIVGDAKQTSVEIRCERGIDTCVLKRIGEQWPANIEFKLHLRGLESLKLTSGNATLEWSVPSSGEEPSRATLHSGKRVSQLAVGDPLFTLAKQVKAKDDSYFLVLIPPRLLAENPGQVKVQWIDFYR